MSSDEIIRLRPRSEDGDTAIVEVTEDELALRVYHARLAGYSIQQIALDFDVTPEVVQRAYHAYRLSRSSSPQREEARELELDRIDGLSTRYYEAGVAGDLKSAEFALKLIQQRSKILQLEAQDPSTPTGAANIIIVGEDREAFMQALRDGKQAVAVDERIESEEANNE